MMTRDAWEGLVSSEGWRIYRQCMKDIREDLKEKIAKAVYEGEDLERAIVECQVRDELANATREGINRFYGIEEEETHEDG